MTDFDYQLAPVLDDVTRDLVQNILGDHNRAENPEFFRLREEPEHQPRPLHVIVRDSTGRATSVPLVRLPIPAPPSGELPAIPRPP